MNQTIQRRFTLLKWIPRILMMAVIGFAIYFGMNYGPVEKPEVTEPKPAPNDPKTQQRGIEYSHFDKGLQVYHVSADKVVQLEGGMQQLDNPVFTFYNEEQKADIVVTGKHCNISRDFNVIKVYDDTEVISKDRMSVRTHQLSYDAREQVFTTKHVAHFNWKLMKGKSKGFTYKIETDQLELPKDPEVEYLNRQDPEKRTIFLKGNSGFIDHRNGFGFFEGQVEATQGNDEIRAHRVEVSFTPGGNDLEKITAIKNVKVNFAKPEHATATGGAAAAESNKNAAPKMSNVFSADSATAKELKAAYAELFFYEDGSTIRAFHSAGDSTFVLHSFDKNNKPREDRIIKGQNFDASFDRNGDMQDFLAAEDVTVRVQPFGNTKREQAMAKQTIHCNDLNATFVPQTGEVKEIHFDNKFRHVQGDRTVSSDKAIYYGNQKKTDLIGSPQIEDASFTITSQSMELFEETSGIRAKGNVKSAFVRQEGKTPSTFPFSSPSNEPVYISSEDMEWNSEKSEATYTTRAKLWQDKNVITASKIVINDKEKTLSGYEKVHTIFYNPGKQTADTKEEPSRKAEKKEEKGAQKGEKKNEKAEKSEKDEKDRFEEDKAMSTGPITVDAGILNYAEKDRIIHFEKDVKIVSQTTKINSEKADFYLKNETSELDRLYAQGKVTINHEGKKGSGSQVTFYEADQKMVMEGGPKLSEAGKADITGRVLTLFLADDRILIDGQDDGRATTTLQMKGKSLPSSKSSNKNKKDAGSSDPGSN